MYDMNLSTSHFPAQNDAEIRDITVGGLLREVAATHPDAVGIVDVADNGDCGQSWTYAEVLAQAERLARALATRFERFREDPKRPFSDSELMRILMEGVGDRGTQRP